MYLTEVEVLYDMEASNSQEWVKFLFVMSAFEGSLWACHIHSGSIQLYMVNFALVLLTD